MRRCTTAPAAPTGSFTAWWPRPLTLWASRVAPSALPPSAVRSWPMTILPATCVQAPHGRAPAVATGVKRGLPGEYRLYLPGRRRLGRHRHGGDGPCRGAPGKYHRDLRQQCHLRHDRRPDGPNHACPVRSPRPLPMAAMSRRLATPSGSAKCSPQLDGAAYLAAGGGQ